MEYERFKARPVELELENEKVIKIKALGKKHWMIFVKFDDPSKKEEALNEMINLTLEESGLTKEEADEVPMFMLVKAILKCNGLAVKEVGE